MATQLTQVVNTTQVTFQLYNWIAGSTTDADNVIVKANGTTITGGKDNDFIKIPNADPVLNFFCLDNMAFTSSTVNLFLYQIGGVVYYTQNGPPNPNNIGSIIQDSGSINRVELTIAQQQDGTWTLLMNAS